MNRFNVKTAMLAMAAVMAGVNSPLHAAPKVDGNVRLGLEYTDNATLTETNEVDDLTVTGMLAGSISEDTGALTGIADASIRQIDYLDNTFGEQTYFQLNAVGNWEPIQNRVLFRVVDQYRQTSIDNLSSNTPSNTENTNAFGLSAGVMFPIADRHTLTVTPSFNDFSYSKSTNDNQQIGLSASWAYQMNRTVELSLRGDYKEVDYDSTPDSQSTSLGLSAAIQRARSRYDFTIGATNVDRDQGTGSDGVTGRINWEYDIASKSQIIAYASSAITDASALFLSSSINPNTGSFNNVQISSDTIRNNVFRVGYDRQDTVIGARTWVELRDLDYETDPLDREVQEVGAIISYGFTPRFTGSVDGRYLRIKETDVIRTDKISTLVGRLAYQLSRKLNANVRVRAESKDSTAAGNGYDELAVFAGFSYQLGRNPAVSRQSSHLGIPAQ